MSIKKQLLITLPFLDAQSFLVRKRQQICIRHFTILFTIFNYWPYYSLRIAFHRKLDFLVYFVLKQTYYGASERHFFLRTSQHLGMIPLPAKGVKNHKKLTIFDHILLMGHDTSFVDFTILLKENKKFKLHLEESLLIKCFKPELNTNI